MDITADYPFNILVDDIATVHQRFLLDPLLREPILKLGINLYSDTPTTVQNNIQHYPGTGERAFTHIQNIKPVKPTDEDVKKFLREHFLQCHLVKMAQLPGYSGEGVQWGSTNSGAHHASSEIIFIMIELVHHLQTCVNIFLHCGYNSDTYLILSCQITAEKDGGNETVSSGQLRLLFIAIFIHEMAHRFIVGGAEGELTVPGLVNAEKAATPSNDVFSVGHSALNFEIHHGAMLSSLEPSVSPSTTSTT